MGLGKSCTTICAILKTLKSPTMKKVNTLHDKPHRHRIFQSSCVPTDHPSFLSFLTEILLFSFLLTLLVYIPPLRSYLPLTLFPTFFHSLLLLLLLCTRFCLLFLHHWCLVGAKNSKNGFQTTSKISSDC